MALVNYLTSRGFVLKALLLLLGAFYLFAGALPKSGDYWIITNISTAFAVDPLHFMADTRGIAFPPTFYALHGAWLWLGSSLFHYNLSVSPYNPSARVLLQTSSSIFYFWGMIPILAALFLSIGIAHKELRNKWLTLIYFGPITFASVIIWGQIDVVCVLFIFASMILLRRALKAQKYLSLLLLGYLTLGVSMQFKTYGGLLLPVYAIYTLALVRTRKLDTAKSLLTLGSCLATLLVATFIVWLPYPGWFSTIMLHGESNYLLHTPSPLFQVPIWVLGYAFILCYTAVRVYRKPLTFLRDDRYFAFDNFVIVAWFFIAVFTRPQWWVFLLPPALLVLDSFRSKNGIVFCILTLFTYLFYANASIGGFWLARVPVWDVITVISRIWYGWVFAFLAGLLLFWVFVLSRELSDKEVKSSTTA